jgi:hypothetical protein
MLGVGEVGRGEFALSGKSGGTDTVDFGAARREGGGRSAKAILIFIRKGTRPRWGIVANGDDFFDE